MNYRFMQKTKSKSLRTRPQSEILMKRSIPPFGNESVRLRLIEKIDLKTTLSWRNQDEARVWFKTAKIITLQQHEEWFNHYQYKDNDFLFVIESRGDLVGQASVYDIQWENGVAEIGRFLAAPQYVGKGLISQACTFLLENCKHVLDLNYVFLEVIENNHHAKKLYQRHGFTEESRYNGLIRMGRKLQ